MYLLDKNSKLEELEKYNYKDENEIQDLLFKNPEIILNLEELQLPKEDLFLVCREFPVSCGFIDLLIITRNADIVFVETKLLRNPESSRTVIAQIIDYIKTSVNYDFETFICTAKKLKHNRINESLLKDDRFLLALKKNFDKGNIAGLILGDEVNNNVFELIESIQSAPHLSFTLYLAELNTFKYNDSLLFYPSIISKTKEIERSVINITITNEKVTIDSAVPDKLGDGSKPKLTWEQYVNSIVDKSKVEIIQNFYKRMNELEPEKGINIGTLGLTAAIIINEERYPIQRIYAEDLEIITDTTSNRNKFKINNHDYYDIYKRELAKNPVIYDKYVVSGKKFVKFCDITNEEMQCILDAAYNLAVKIKEEN